MLDLYVQGLRDPQILEVGALRHRYKLLTANAWSMPD